MANKLMKGALKSVQNKNLKLSHKKECGCCGGSELWYMSMIQCSACQRWFHEGCVKCLSHPLLLGDCFYIFVCSSCNLDVEYVGRLQLTWLELVHLVLFHLMFKYRVSYYDLDVEILPWVKDNWPALQTGMMRNVSDEERRKEFLAALKTNPNRFKCGDETRKKVSWWALRVYCPPTAPKYELLVSGAVLTNSAVNEILASKPSFIDRKNERLQPVKRVFNCPCKDEYYEKWMKIRSEYKRRKRRTETVSLPKRKAALECREKCKKIVKRKCIRDMPVSDDCNQSASSCNSKHDTYQASSRRLPLYVEKDCRSHGQRSNTWRHQTSEPKVKGIPSSSKLLKKPPSSQIRKVSQKKKRGNKTRVNNDIVVKRGRPRKLPLCSGTETILWTHHVMAGVKSTAVELQGRNCTQKELTMMMARIPFYSRPVDDVKQYFKDTGNLTAREGCKVMGKRVSPEGLVQYLVVKNESVNSFL